MFWPLLAGIVRSSRMFMFRLCTCTSFSVEFSPGVLSRPLLKALREPLGMRTVDVGKIEIDAG